jgi:anti-sigma B factor antagonist
MSVSITVRKTKDVCILDVEGRITIGEGASTLRETLRMLPKQGHSKLLLNLADATMIDSTGLGVLVAGFASITNQGGQLKLVKLTTRIRDLLLMTKLFTVFEVFEDEAGAVRSFSVAEAAMPGRGA